MAIRPFLAGQAIQDMSVALERVCGELQLSLIESAQIHHLGFAQRNLDAIKDRVMLRPDTGRHKRLHRKRQSFGACYFPLPGPKSDSRNENNSAPAASLTNILHSDQS